MQEKNIPRETWKMRVFARHSHVMKPFLIRWFITTVAVLGVTVLPFVGVHADRLGALLGAGLLLGFFNAFLRPVLLLLSLPLLLLTGGLFFFLLNAFTLYLVGHAIPGFHVDGFWSALFGSILIGFFSWFLGLFMLPGGSRGGRRFHVRTFRGDFSPEEEPASDHTLRGGAMGSHDNVERPGSFERDVKPVRGRVIE